MIKIISSIYFCSLFLTSCSQKSSNQKILLNPTDSTKYQISIYSKSLHLDINVVCSFKKETDSVYVTSVIKKINYQDGSDLEKSINSDNQQYINSTLSTLFNTHGKIIKSMNPLNIFNTNLLFIELPDNEMRIGNTWEGKRSAKPDFLFDSIITKYSCRRITDAETTVNVQMDFVEETKSKTDITKFSKRYDGYYIINNATGTVKSANLDITGFNGISDMIGSIEIKEIRD